VAKTKNLEVAMNRRAKADQRGTERRVEEKNVEVERRVSARRKVPRRRQIDPTTCERDYSDDEIQFMHALDAYKRTSGRMFPTCSEILEVIRALGYVKTEVPATPVENATEASPEQPAGDAIATDAEPVFPCESNI
jgi:hypothetical protein